VALKVGAAGHFAIDEKRVGRAVDERAAVAVFFDEHPRAGDRLLQKRRRLLFLRRRHEHAAQMHGHFLSFARDDERARIFDAQHALHRCLGAHGETHHDCDYDSLHDDCAGAGGETRGVEWWARGG
jgi:hypothetical protein